ncbi:hypothetical protein C8R46DRAFT_1346463 [Mycena filopes]|nr:hypothetical protein C8R46DRAFT_1346463 [Mycena filopes]
MSHFILFNLFASLLAQTYAVPVPQGTDAPTHYHATCADSASTIQQNIAAGALLLWPSRPWADEFAWSGGTYLTPNQDNAIAYGASFLTHCTAENRGGVVIMGLIFDTAATDSQPALRVNSLGITGDGPQMFWNDQMKFGMAIREHLDPKIDPYTTHPTRPPPNPEQMDEIRRDPASLTLVPQQMWAAYDELALYDVVTGAVPMHEDQVEATKVAVGYGMPAIQEPFIQVVLVTDTGKSSLTRIKFVEQVPLDPKLTAKQPALYKKFKPLSARNPNLRRALGMAEPSN